MDFYSKGKRQSNTTVNAQKTIMNVISASQGQALDSLVFRLTIKAPLLIRQQSFIRLRIIVMAFTLIAEDTGRFLEIPTLIEPSLILL
jgi:hypothetical protein